MANTVSIMIPSDVLTAGEYTVSITAVDSWGAESNTLSRKTTIANTGA